MRLEEAYKIGSKADGLVRCTYAALYIKVGDDSVVPAFTIMRNVSTMTAEQWYAQMQNGELPSVNNNGGVIKFETIDARNKNWYAATQADAINLNQAVGILNVNLPIVSFDFDTIEEIKDGKYVSAKLTEDAKEYIQEAIEIAKQKHLALYVDGKFVKYLPIHMERATFDSWIESIKAEYGGEWMDHENLVTFENGYRVDANDPMTPTHPSKYIYIGYYINRGDLQEYKCGVNIDNMAWMGYSDKQKKEKLEEIRNYYVNMIRSRYEGKAVTPHWEHDVQIEWSMDYKYQRLQQVIDEDLDVYVRPVAIEFYPTNIDYAMVDYNGKSVLLNDAIADAEKKVKQAKTLLGIAASTNII